ncbi:MAG: dynamin family protein [Bacillaceae bacterium]|nr:dynamin family protein [Bacillaceae bacterium]
MKTEMDRSLTGAEKEKQLSRLTTLYHFLKASGDDKQAEKAAGLIQKLKSDHLVVAFCGHFSAGKSSMINGLVGDAILPSSPVPTSANLVSIRTGEKAVRARIRDRGWVRLPADREWGELRRFFVDGAEVETVQIQHPTPFLPEGVILMDTPGIDSTDDAHRIATESALHLADVVFYVMDYNHVQSEVNFAFTRNLQEHGKEIYLVVNQVDKHQELELDFTHYQESVQASFAAWGVEPAAIFYTSMMEADHPYNQLEQLKNQLTSIFSERGTRLVEGMEKASRRLADDHMNEWREQHEEDRENRLALLSQEGLEGDGEQAIAHYRKVAAQLDELDRIPQQLEQDMTAEMQAILKNANITPYATRELAGKYLESRNPRFKVGFLFTASKTQAEIEKRLQDFHASVQEQVSANLEWHLKNMLMQMPEKYGFQWNDYRRELSAWHIPIESDLLKELVKESSVESLTGQYILQYNRDLAEEIKNRFRRQAMDWIAKAVEQAKQSAVQKRRQLEEEQATWSKLAQAVQELKQLEQEEQERQQQLDRILSGEIDADLGQGDRAVPYDDLLGLNTASPDETQSMAEWSEPVEAGTTDDDRETEVRNQLEQADRTVSSYDEAAPAAEPKPDDQDTADSRERLTQSARQLRETAAHIRPITGFRTMAANMEQRAARLEQNLFTVALFGAFSAGKSSFASALLGDKVLPVSPNPTTAAVNQILPPTETFPHGTVRVFVKEKDAMKHDMEQSMQAFNLNGDPFRDLKDLIGTVDPESIPPQAKPHLSFLSAASRGMDRMEGELGRVLTVGLEDFQPFVMDEEKACFVERIELYYDCPLTAKGITLVDTPGADSINARHTGVAFEYIKNADAILFVTYYNHAFSHADREFLIQLGRVKDTFDMDKMFFIVNAADLARNRQDMQDVVDHVRQNLLQYGIRHPRLYPVSSQTALMTRLKEKGKLPDSAAKTYQQSLTRLGASDAAATATGEALALSGITRFEQDFMTFTVEELTRMAVKSAEDDIRRAQAQLEELLATAREDESVRSRKRDQALQARESAKTSILQAEWQMEWQSVEQEIQELVFYVKKRIFERFGEWFHEAFNPSDLQGDGRHLKQALMGSLEELIGMMGYDLAQEMRATALRVEKFMNGQASKIYGNITGAVNRISEGCRFASYQPRSYSTPSFEEGLKDLDLKAFQPALSLFKNPRDFFEKGGKDKLRDRLEKELEEPVSTYLQEEGERVRQEYEELFRQQMDMMKNELQDQLEQYYEGVLAALSDEIDTESLEKSLEHIRGVTGRTS